MKSRENLSNRDVRHRVKQFVYAVFNMIIMIAQWESCRPFSLGCGWGGRDVKQPAQGDAARSAEAGI